jgi:hypothetical protein
VLLWLLVLVLIVIHEEEEEEEEALLAAGGIRRRRLSYLVTVQFWTSLIPVTHLVTNLVTNLVTCMSEITLLFPGKGSKLCRRRRRGS